MREFGIPGDGNAAARAPPDEEKPPSADFIGGNDIRKSNPRGLLIPFRSPFLPLSVSLSLYLSATTSSLILLGAT